MAIPWPISHSENLSLLLQSFLGMVNTETGVVDSDVSTAAVAVGMDSLVNHEHCPQETYHVSAPTS